MRPLSANAPLSDPALERLARQRAGLKLGWLVHCTVYVAVNLLLAGLAWSNGGDPSRGPLLGWGLGLALHGLVVLLVLPGRGLGERLLARERQQVASQAADRR